MNKISCVQRVTNTQLFIHRMQQKEHVRLMSPLQMKALHPNLSKAFRGIQIHRNRGEGKQSD